MIEIDGIYIGLQHPATVAGDYIADTYWRVVDLTTAPGLTTSQLNSLASAVRKLNRNKSTTSVYFDFTELASVYDSVAQQVNHLNSGYSEVPNMEPLIRVPSKFADYSASFIW